MYDISVLHAISGSNFKHLLLIGRPTIWKRLPKITALPIGVGFYMTFSICLIYFSKLIEYLINFMIELCALAIDQKSLFSTKQITADLDGKKKHSKLLTVNRIGIDVNG